MAKKKSKKKATGGRRRVGKIPGGDAVPMIVGAIGGAILTKFANKQIGTKVKPALLAGGEALVGGMVAAKAKNPFIKGIGIGMAAAGGGALVGTLVPSLAGVGDQSLFITTQPKYLNGMENNPFRNVPKVGVVPGAFPRPASVGNARMNGINRVSGIAGGIMS